MRVRHAERSRIEVRVQRSAFSPSGLGIPRIFLERGLLSALGRHVVARRRVSVVPGELHAILRTHALPTWEPTGGAGIPRARMDLSARAALGISEREAEARDVEVTLETLHIGWRRRGQELCARIFGVRYVMHRVVLALAVDAERAVVRVDRTALDLLGCDSGDRVVLTAPTRRERAAVAMSIVTQVFEVPRPEIAERERRELSTESHDARYRSFRNELGLEFDVPRVYVPGDLRDELNLEHGDSVLLRREIPSLFSRSFREFGLLVLLSGLAVAQLPIPVRPGWWATAILVLVAIALGVFFTGASIRSRVRGSWRWRGGARSRRTVTPSDNVWYAGYGSNLLPSRFLCYLEGGRVEGMARANPGARNPAAFDDLEAGTIPGRLRFAGSFTSWASDADAAGAAMIDPTAASDTLVHAVAYRITVEQLVDVLLQECGFDPRDLDAIDVRYAVQRRVMQHLQDRDGIDDLRGPGISEVRPLALGHAPYGRLVSLPLQRQDGSARTVHVVAPVAGQPSNPPSVAYLATMRAGLIEAAGLSPDAVDAYLLALMCEADQEAR